jgi:hypothetical protein
MDIIKERHSVRQYKDKKIEQDKINQLINEIKKFNQESGLNIQLVINEPKAFKGFIAHYGKFRNVKNYIALIGNKDSLLEEKCGYYGERLVLLAQQLGLNTCWVALTYSKVKNAYVMKDNEKLCAVIALGYGENQGIQHRSKSFNDVIEVDGDIPNWFKLGVEAALLAPTAMNQQKFKFYLKDNQVSIIIGKGFYTQLDKGIIKYHFELVAKNNFKWLDSHF